MVGVGGAKAEALDYLEARAPAIMRRCWMWHDLLVGSCHVVAYLGCFAMRLAVVAGCGGVGGKAVHFREYPLIT